MTHTHGADMTAHPHSPEPIEKLIERSSLGTAGAYLLRARASTDQIEEVLGKADDGWFADVAQDIPRMTYRILGQLTIEGEDGALPLPSGHRLIALAALLINANRRVSSSDLLRAVWGHTEVETTQLHKCMSELRTLLDRLGRRDDLVTHSRYGYELRISDRDLDKLTFERLLRQAEAARARRRVEDEIGLLRSALRLWRGPRPLEGVPSDPFRRESDELEQRRKRAAVRLYMLELAAGRYEEIIGELGTIVTYHPTDRRLCELLMLALYHGGHQTEALSVYERHSAALAEDVGAEPEVALRNLMYAIASADKAAIARYEDLLRQSGSPVRLADVPRELPADLADFVARDDHVAEASWLLTPKPYRATPVVVVTGPGGIGKTALAVHVAHRVRSRYPDGQLYVELRGRTAEPLDVDEALAQILRGFGAKVPTTTAERAALYRTLVSDRRVLLLLDDARDETQVQELIPGSSTCGVLVTARQRMPAIDGAHHLLILPPLDEAASKELFARVVRDSGIEPPPESVDVRQVIDLCGGLPLALRIAAAARVRSEDVGFQGQTRQTRGGSVERSITIGVDRLDRVARVLFLAFGLLEIPHFGLWTAAAALGSTAETSADALLRLAEGNLLQPVGSSMRYQFHDLTREYARHRAEREYANVSARRAVFERVYGGLLTLVRHAHRSLYGGDFDVVHSKVPDLAAPAEVLAELETSPMNWYETERFNIRAAIRHTADLGLAELCWDLAVSTHEFYTVRGYLDDWHATHMIALDACRAAGNLRGEAAVMATLGQPTLASSARVGLPTVDDLASSVDMFERLDDTHGRAIALRTLANALRRRGRLDDALDAFRLARSLYEASTDRAGHWQALRYIGQTYFDLGRYDDALHELRKAQEATYDESRSSPIRETYWTRLQAQTTYWIGQTHLALGNMADARDAFKYVFDAVGDTDDTSRAYAAHGLGEIARSANDLAEAEEHLSAACRLARETHDVVLEGRVQLSLADLHRRQRRDDDETAALERAVFCFTVGGIPHRQADALFALGDAHARRGAISSARAAYSAANDLYLAVRRPEADAVRQKLDQLPPS